MIPTGSPTAPPTDKIGGKKLATADRTILKKLVNGHAIRGTRIFPYPPHYEMLGPEPIQIEANDVGRLAGKGLVDVDDRRYGDVWTYSITEKGRKALLDGVVEKPLEQGKLL